MREKPARNSVASPHGINEEMRFGMQYQNHDGEDHGVVNQGYGQRVRSASDAGSHSVDEWEDIEEKALQMAIDEVYEGSGRKFRPWAANGRSIRVGEIILIVDSDTVVPEDCLRDAARELAECPDVAIIQHESDVMQVAHHYFENGIAYFTRRINRAISLSASPQLGLVIWALILDALPV